MLVAYAKGQWTRHWKYSENEETDKLEKTQSTSNDSLVQAQHESPMTTNGTAKIPAIPETSTVEPETKGKKKNKRKK